MNFVSKPNLPDKKVTTVIIGEVYKDTINALYKLGIKCITIPFNKSLPKQLAYHADMNVLHLGENKFAVASENKKLSISGLNISSSCDLGNTYPYDIALNIALIGNIALVGKKNINNNLLNDISSQNYNIIKVKQGYCKCSVCVVNESAIITDDKNIATALHNFLDVLLISKGSIELKGYNYGFIGGCCGLIDHDLLAFTGDIERHSDCENIKSFLKNHSCNYICLDKNNLIDIGGMLPIKTI